MDQISGEFTRENRGAYARLGVLGPDVGPQTEVDDQPLDGISAESKADEHNVSITFGSGYSQANCRSKGMEGTRQREEQSSLS